MPELPIYHDPAWASFAFLQRVIDTLADPIFVKDLQHRWVACNQAFCTLIGRSYAELIGHSDPDYWPPEQAAIFWEADDKVFVSNEPFIQDESATDASGITHTIWTRKFPMHDDAGIVIGLCGIITDITDIQQRQARVALLEATLQEKLAVIEAQGTLLEQVSVPVIQVWEGVLLLPLVGALDSQRAVRVLENLLGAIERFSATFVILDITGVPVVDTSVASYLIRSVQASQLLGCTCFLVGISPEIAQTLVGLGIDFSDLRTYATLQKGLEYVFKQLQAA